MVIKFMTLAHKISEYKQVVLYGAGTMAKIVYEGLIKCGIVISFCVVTKKNEDFFMEKVPVYEIEECKDVLKNKDMIILLAVNETYEMEIKSILEKLGINRWFYLSSFIVENLLKEYSNKSLDECLEEISEWIIANTRDDWKNFELIKKKLEAEINIKEIDNNKIIFAVGNLTPRVLKIVNAIQDTKYEIKILFYPNFSICSTCKEELKRTGIVSIECNCIEELIYRIITEHAKVVHMFSNIENTSISYILIKLRSIMPSLVFDQYDIINGFYYNYPLNWLEEEKYCLENADGLCNRGYELDHLIQKYNYHFKGRVLHFFDYCRNDSIMKYEAEFNEELSICYAGGVITEKEYPNSPIACWLELAQICTKAQCHLHIYPARWSEDVYAEYIELDKYNEFFHFHYPVSSNLLNQELSQYDYGIHPIKANFLEQEIVAYNRKDKLIYGVTNHFYDYLDAGIPIIAVSPTLFAESFAKKGVLIPWTIEEYDFDYLRKNKKGYREKVKLAQKELQIKKHIHELTMFYELL